MENIDFQRQTDAEIWAVLPDLEPREKCDALRVLGLRAFERGEYSRAASLSGQVAAIALDIDDPRFAAWNFGDQGLATCRGGDCAEAIGYFREAARCYETAGDELGRAQVLGSIANCAVNISNHVQALEAATTAFEISTAEEDLQVAGLAAYNAGKATYLLDEEQVSLEWLARARTAFQTQGDVGRVGMVDDYAATVHDYLGNYEQAEELLRSCLHIADATSNASDDAYARRRLGKALMRLRRNSDAVVYLRQARDSYQAKDDLRSVAWIDRDLADVLTRLDEDDEALRIYERAEALFYGFGEGRQVNYCRMQRAWLHDVYGRAGEAERLMRQVLASIEADPTMYDDDYPVWVALRLCHVLVESGRSVDALMELDQLPKVPEIRDGYLAWEHTLRARAFFDLEGLDDALQEAKLGLAKTTQELINGDTGYLYEIRGRIGLSRGDEAAERDLAHAIAIHLASGVHDRARELAQHFMPNLGSRADQSEPDPVSGGQAPSDH